MNLTSADSGSDQAVCMETLSGDEGTYIVNPDGTGTLTINFPNATASSGTHLQRDGRRARRESRQAAGVGRQFSGVTICGEPITTLVLCGEL